MKEGYGESARRRVECCHEQQVKSLEAILSGKPREAEPDPARARARAEAQARWAPAGEPVVAPEAIRGDTEDFVGVAFLERGMRAARTVARVASRQGQPQGTGFLVAPGLFLTNHHVLESAADCQDFVIELDYEADAEGRRREPTRFELNPGEFFISDDRDDLDYTLVAVGQRLDGPFELEHFGFSTLSGAGDKHALGEVANIVQHPDGRLKEVVLRENRLVSRLAFVLHYVADTEPGSSGSPVFNNQWQAIALHHWGGPWRQDRGPDGRPVPRFVNEGIRISAIVGELRERLEGLERAWARRLEEALALGQTRSISPAPSSDRPEVAHETPRVEVRADGTAVWRLPIEIAVGVPALGSRAGAAPPANGSAKVAAEGFRRKVDRNYEGRKGYRERFLSGHVIPMPHLRAGAQDRLAPNLEAEAGEDPYELPYEHFSVYVDRRRGLPLVTACNIDGKNLKSINRKTGKLTRAERMQEDSGPEAREKWYVDPRLDPQHCGNDALYTGQKVSDGPNRVGRIFHRGHMVRRLDPCWGSDRAALRAEADTFHFTNCTPQIGKFNSGKKLWQGIENHVLDNARLDDLRVIVFTGPILAHDDPPYRQDVFPGFRVPREFWKIAVWKDGGKLSALALLASQQALLDQGQPERAEDLGDTEKVEEFVATIPWIEEYTGLDFGDEVRAADLFEEAPEGAEGAGRDRGRRRIHHLAELPLRARSGRS